MLRRPFALEQPLKTVGRDGMEYSRRFVVLKPRMHGIMIAPVRDSMLSVIFDWRHNMPSIRLGGDELGEVSSIITLLKNHLARRALRRALEKLRTVEGEYIHDSS